MQDELGTEQVQDQQVDEKPSDPFVERALELGWRPQEEWTGPEEEFIDAKEFVRRQPLFEKIEAQSREIRAVKQGLDALKTHHAKVKEVEKASKKASKK